MRWYVWLAAAALFLPAVGVADKDQTAIQGTWTVTEAEQDGQPLDRIKGNTLTVDGDKFTIATKTSDLKGTLTLYPDTMPKGVDWTHTEGAVEGRVWYAIYSLEGDDLKLCYKDPNPEKQRPGEFATKPGTNTLFVTLKRGTP